MKNESVKAFEKRRFNRLMARMDADDEEGQWITTENGHKVHINAEGEPDIGNSHVLAAMKGEGGSSKGGSAKSASPSKAVPKNPTMRQYREHPWGKDKNADKEMTKNAMKTGGPVAREAMGDVINNLDIDFETAGMNDLEFADQLMGDFADTGYLDTLRDEWGDDYPFTVGGWRSRKWSPDNEEADTKFAELCYKYGDRRTKAEVVGNLEEVVEEGFRDESELKPWEKEALGLTGRNSSSASRSSSPRTTAQSVSKLNEMTSGFYGNRQDIYDDLKDNGFSYEDFGEYISVFDNNNPQDTEFVLKLGGTERSITIDDVRAEKAPDSDDDYEDDWEDDPNAWDKYPERYY